MDQPNTWKLIEFAPEMVHDLRLTSRLIKECVDEYAMQRGTIPLISDIRLNWEPKKRFLGTLFGAIEVPTDKSKLFELRL